MPSFPLNSFLNSKIWPKPHNALLKYTEPKFWVTTFQFHALMILKWILPKYVHSNGLKLSGAIEELSIASQFLDSKRQLSTFWRNSARSFYWIEVQVITNPSSRFEKHQTLDFLLMTDFLGFFLNMNFCIFHYFRKWSAAHTKIIVCLFFNVTMLDQTQYSLNSPFSNDTFIQAWCPLPVLTWNLNCHLNGICIFSIF